MLFNLVKKDFILAKKYWLLMLAFAIGAPIYVETQTHTMSGGLPGYRSFVGVYDIQFGINGRG